MEIKYCITAWITNAAAVGEVYLLFLHSVSMTVWKSLAWSCRSTKTKKKKKKKVNMSIVLHRDCRGRSGKLK